MNSSRLPTIQNSSSSTQIPSDVGSTATGVSEEDTSHSRIPQTTAFTVHFDSDNKFTKRHVRNLSLPISKLYDGKVNCDNRLTVNGKTPEGVKPIVAVGVGSNVSGSVGLRSSRSGKAAGNHSEGYFSSDAEDDGNHPKLFVAKLHSSVKKGSKPTNLAQEKRVDLQHRLNMTALEGDKTESGKGNLLKKGVKEEVEEEGDSSDGVSEVSETGTYTIDKEKDRENVEVITARLNIDSTFGVNHQTTVSTNNDEHNNYDSAHSSLSWVNDWATQVVEHNSLTGININDPVLSTAAVSPQQKPTSLPTQGSTVSKIPSPVSNVRAQFRLSSAGPTIDRTSSVPSKLSPRSKRSFTINTTANNRQAHRDEYSDSSLETESFLLATEKVVSAMAARVSLSMDSGGESDVDTSHSCSNKKQVNSNASSTPVSAVATPASVVQSDSSASESGGGGSRKINVTATTNSSSVTTPTTTTRYNRAFSLRRGRLDDPNKKENKTGTPAVTPGGTGETIVSKLKRNVDVTRHASTPPNLPSQIGSRLTKGPVAIGSRTSPTTQSAAAPHRSQSFTRTDCGRYSMRSIKTNQTGSPLLTNQNKVDIMKKKGSSGRSNSTLSSREVEFQNWKRRKSYDPMKAAAEGKKKEAAKKQLQTTSTQAKSSGNPVLRSASFHGTRQLAVPSSSEEDDDGEEEDENEGEEEEEVVASAEEYEEEEDWPAPAAPRTSLESTPRGSRVSLYSNASNSSLRSRPKLEGVDNLVISALSGLSGKIKVGSCNLLKKLRYLYDEDSPKAHQLSAEIEQLEVSEPGSPHHSAVTNTNNNNSNRSPSRELSTALRNLKRIESVIKILDNVLFDNEDFE